MEFPSFIRFGRDMETYELKIIMDVINDLSHYVIILIFLSQCEKCVIVCDLILNLQNADSLQLGPQCCVCR